MRHQLLVVFLLVVFSLGFGPTPVGAEAGPVSITGTWGLQYMGSEGPIKMTFVFKQEGEKLSGTFSGVGPMPAILGLENWASSVSLTDATQLQETTRENHLRGLDGDVERRICATARSSTRQQQL
jgi:hypothetical protein